VAFSEVILSGSFLREVKWAKEMIVKIQEYKVKNLPMGFTNSAQPDDILAEFTSRELPFAPYYRGQGLAIGGPEAYLQNIGAIVGYVERERQEEVQSAQRKIDEILGYKARGAAIGLAWPNGHPDDFARYFVLRGLTIAYYVRGAVNAGDTSAYDKNIDTLNAYIGAVGGATYR
jgi:hypothetical protein